MDSKKEDQSTPELDLLVVVGGEEFWENSTDLGCFSDYFQEVLGSGMKESQERKIEWKLRDPQEWKLIRELLKPNSLVDITETNIQIVVDWYEFLQVPGGLQKCDKALRDIMDAHLHRIFVCGDGDHNENENKTCVREERCEIIGAILEATAISVHCKLELSKQFGIKCLVEDCLSRLEAPTLEHFQQFESILRLDSQSKECRDYLLENSNHDFDGFIPKELFHARGIDFLVAEHAFAKMCHENMEKILQDNQRIANTPWAQDFVNKCLEECPQLA